MELPLLPPAWSSLAICCCRASKVAPVAPACSFFSSLPEVAVAETVSAPLGTTSRRSPPTARRRPRSPATQQHAGHDRNPRRPRSPATKQHAGHDRDPRRPRPPRPRPAPPSPAQAVPRAALARHGRAPRRLPRPRPASPATPPSPAMPRGGWLEARLATRRASLAARGLTVPRRPGPRGLAAPTRGASLAARGAVLGRRRRSRWRASAAPRHDAGHPAPAARRLATHDAGRPAPRHPRHRPPRASPSLSHADELLPI